MAAQAACAWGRNTRHRGLPWRGWWRVFSSSSGSAQAPRRTAKLCCTNVSARAGLEQRPAGAEDGRPVSSSAHSRTTQDPVRVCHGSHLPAPVALGPRRSNTHQSLQLSSHLTVGDDIIADDVSLLNVVRMLGLGEPTSTSARYEPSADNIVCFHESQSPTTATTGTAQSGWGGSAGRAVTKVNNPLAQPGVQHLAW